MNPTLPSELFTTLPPSCQEEWDVLLAAHDQSAVTSVRINPNKPHHHFKNVRSVPWCESGLYLHERPLFTSDPYLHAGGYYVQEASSMFLDWILRKALPDRSKLRALDLCASPGGKSTLTAALLPPDALLLSNEVVPNRVQALVENAVKWGYANHWVCNNSASQLGRLEQYFDLILVDAPCSGSGLFRKIPEFRSEWKPEDVEKCSLRQQTILDEVLPSLASNGILIYMTCSFSIQENEEMIDYLLLNNNLEPLLIPIPEEWGVQITRGTKGEGWGYRFMPHHLEGEGFFLSVFKNVASGDKKKGNGKHSLSPVKGMIEEYLTPTEMNPYLLRDQFFLLHPEHLPDLQEFEKRIRLVKRGTLLGKYAGKDLIPDHELAMSIHLSANPERIELTREQAITYLKKEPLYLDLNTRGWKLVRYLGCDLGWIKSIPGRLNNYYPSGYRILNKNIG